MKEIVLKVQDHKFAFVLELLNSLPFVEAKERPTRAAAKPQDETEYLLSTPANAARLLESIAELERGEGHRVTLD